MIITINEETLTAIIVDDADAPTKQCVLGNWNPEKRKKWAGLSELESYAKKIARDERFFSDYLAPEALAEEPVSEDPVAP